MTNFLALRGVTEKRRHTSDRTRPERKNSAYFRRVALGGTFGRERLQPVMSAPQNWLDHRQKTQTRSDTAASAHSGGPQLGL